MALTEDHNAATPWIPKLTFGRRLLLLRNELGLTQEQIARKCGIHPATWNTWEHGSSPRNQGDVVQKISEATGADKGWLLWGLLAPIILDTPPEQLAFTWDELEPPYDPIPYRMVAGF